MLPCQLVSYCTDRYESVASWSLIVAYIDTNNVVTRSLEALVQVGAAEAGIPQVLLAAVELMANSFGSDNELAQASRCAHFSLDVPYVQQICYSIILGECCFC